MLYSPCRMKTRNYCRVMGLVALSADALPEQIDAALASGFESYLTKPLDFRKLLSLLDGVALAT